MKLNCLPFLLIFFIVGVLSIFPISNSACAETVSHEEYRSLLERLTALSDEVANLKRQLKQQESQIQNLGVKPQGATVETTLPSSTGTTQTSSTAKRTLVPDIGVVGDFVATMSESSEDEEGNDRLAVRSVELVLGHDIDPYSRFDATIAFSDTEEPELEEAYITHFGLPYKSVGKLGRFRPKVGISSSIHRDSLDTVDYALVISDLFGEEGYVRTGAELSNVFGFFSDTISHEIVVGILEGGVGHKGTLFGETRRRPTAYSRLKNSWEISELNFVTLGASFLTGSSDEDSSFEVKAYGLDLSTTQYFSPTSRVKLQSEVFIQDRNESSTEENENLDPVGMYALADLRLNQSWGTGYRFDYNELTEETELRDYDTAHSVYLTYYQSEFLRWRFQYQYFEPGAGESDNRFILQATAAIGTHKHNIQ